MGSGQLDGKTVAFAVANEGVEQLELTGPWDAVVAAGGQPVLVPVAAICHAPMDPVEADVVKGRTLTSWPSLRTDVTNTGGRWKDEEVVRDGMLVTSRKPDDLPAFNEAMVALLASTQVPRRRTGILNRSFGSTGFP